MLDGYKLPSAWAYCNGSEVKIIIIHGNLTKKNTIGAVDRYRIDLNLSDIASIPFHHFSVNCAELFQKFSIYCIKTCEMANQLNLVLQFLHFQKSFFFRQTVQLIPD